VGSKRSSKRRRHRQPEPAPTPPRREGIEPPRPLVIRLALAAIVAFVVAVRLQFLSIPFERDEGDYFYLAQRLLDGGTPYVSFYEQKLPGLFYAYALILLCFGHTVEGAHLGFIVVNVVTVVLVYFVGRTLLDGFAGVIAAATFALLSLGPQVSGFTTQSEHLIALLATAGTLVLLRSADARRWWHFLLAGALLGASFLVKPNAVFFIVFGVAVLLGRGLVRDAAPWPALLRDAGIYLAGVAAVCVAAVLPVVAQGATREMWYWTYEFPRDYVSQVSLSVGLRWFGQALGRVTDGYLFFWLAALSGLILLWSAPVPLRSKLVIALLAGFSFLAIVPGLRFFGHYWLQLLPATALATGAAFHGARAMLSRRLAPSRATVLLAVLFVGAAASSVWAKRAYHVRPDHTRVLRDVYRMNPFPEAKVVGQFLREHTGEQDQIVVLGSEPQIYFYADRRAPTRHHYLTFLTGDKQKLPRSTEFQQEFVRDVSVAKPRYMVFVKDRISWIAHPNADRSILGWFDRFAAEHYQLVGLVDIIGPDETRYRWYGDVAGYQPKGQSAIRIYERKAP
jgi:4-amino-4-deoxy-L-arabinose transferase-like glycosyltransferase